MKTEDFAYELSSQLVAAFPRPRGTSRLLVLDRTKGTWESTVRHFPALLAPGDLVLVNDVRVIPARLVGSRAGGGRCELLLLRPRSGGAWEAMGRPAARLKVGCTVRFPWGLGVVREKSGEGRLLVAFEPPLDTQTLEKVGQVPLPPYIERKRPASPLDRERYQTVYAASGRAVAAPTAGLHLTVELLEELAGRGVEVASLTLHVGPGTFKPVKAQDPRAHRLDPELYDVSPEAARSINGALAAGRRIVCVGTTVVRALEDALARGEGRVYPGSAWAETYILPGFAFRGTGALLTNFHLPRSTLLMLVAALAGRERVMAAYELAKSRGFRFYSYGDAMLVV
ncbi:MAG: tRNA preQ1(34) S-adenosylmethionine ribosyltransferase-isomerase QueA [Thermoanaerobaculum sp.]